MVKIFAPDISLDNKICICGGGSVGYYSYLKMCSLLQWNEEAPNLNIYSALVFVSVFATNDDRWYSWRPICWMPSFLDYTGLHFRTNPILLSARRYLFSSC